MNTQIKPGDYIQFYTCCNADRKRFTGVVAHKEQLGLICVVEGIQYELNKLVDITVLPPSKHGITKPATAQTVFYENSMGFLAQWVIDDCKINGHELILTFPGRPPKGSPHRKRDKRKALRFDLRESGFLVITKNELPWQGIGVDADPVSVSQDEATRQRVLTACTGQIAHQWNGKNWVEMSS